MSSPFDNNNYTNPSKKRRLSRRAIKTVKDSTVVEMLNVEDDTEVIPDEQPLLPSESSEVRPLSASIVATQVVGADDAADAVMFQASQQQASTSSTEAAAMQIVIAGPSSGVPPISVSFFQAMSPALLEVNNEANVGGDIELSEVQRALVLQRPPQQQQRQLQLPQGRIQDHGWQESRLLLTDRASFLLNNPRMSDIRFLVGEGRVEMHGHKTILAMGSPVFEAQFFGCFKTTDEVIELPDCDPQTFQLFLKYLYTDTLEEPIDDVKVLNLLRPAKKYIVPHLIEKCSDILMSELKPSNVFQVHNYAEFFDLQKLGGACLRFIDRESKAIVQTEEFTMLNSETLGAFLKRDGLNITEIELFKAVLRWAEFECDRRQVENTDENIRDALGENILIIRFPTMTPEQFATDVAPRKILTAEESTSVFIYMCAGYHNRVNPAFIPQFPIKKRGFYPEQYLVNRFNGEPNSHSLNYRSGEIYTYRFNVKADRQIFFKGVNIFSIKCAIHVDQRRFNGAVYLYDTAEGDRDLNREKARKQFSREGSLEPEFETTSGSRFFPVLFDNEVRIPANQMFTVCAVVSVASSNFHQQPLTTFMGNDEMTDVMIRCAEDLVVNFHFSNCNGENSVGRYTQSQIPEIVFSL